MSIWQRIAETPFWVFTFYVVMIYFAYLSTKKRVVSLKTMYFYPVLFSLLSVSLFTLHTELLNLVLWTISLFFGLVLGYLQFKAMRIKAIRGANQLQSTGSWFFLIFILIALLLKIFFYSHITYQDLLKLQEPENFKWLCTVYGAVTGLMYGRLFAAKRCLIKGPFVDLEVSN